MTQPPWPGRQDESSRGMKVRAHHTGSQMLQQAEIDGLMLTCMETGTGEQNSINRAGATVHGAGQAKSPSRCLVGVIAQHKAPIISVLQAQA